MSQDEEVVEEDAENEESADQEEEEHPSTTKTVIIANDVHTAVKRLSNLEDATIQDTVDDILRSDYEVQEELRIIEERRSN